MGAHRGADRAGGTHRRGAAGAAVTGAVVDAAGGDRAGGGGLRPGARRQAVAAAVVYGVRVLVASLPGAVVLVTVWLRRARPAGRPEPLPTRIRVARRPEGVDV